MKIKYIDKEIPSNYTEISDKSQFSQTKEYNGKKYTFFAVGEKAIKGKHRFWVGFRSLAKIIFSLGSLWRKNETVRDDWIAAWSGKRKVTFYKLDEIKPSLPTAAIMAQSVNTGSQKVFDKKPISSQLKKIEEKPEIPPVPIIEDKFVEIPEFDIQQQVDELAKNPRATLVMMKKEIADKIANHINEHITLESNPDNVKELMGVLIGKATGKLVEKKFGKSEQQVSWNIDIDKLVRKKLDELLWEKVNQDLSLLKQVMRSPHLTEITKEWNQYLINDFNALCSLAKELAPNDIEKVESLKVQCLSLSAILACSSDWKISWDEFKGIITDKYVESIHQYHNCVIEHAFTWTKSLRNFVTFLDATKIVKRAEIQEAVFNDKSIQDELKVELFEKIHKSGDWKGDMAIYKAVAGSIFSLETYVKAGEEFTLQDFTGFYQTIVNELQNYRDSITASEDILLNRYMGVLRGLFEELYLKSQEILQKTQVQVLSLEYRSFRRAYETCGELIGAPVKVEVDMNTENDAWLLQQVQLKADEEAARHIQEQEDARLAQMMDQDPNFIP